MTAPKKSNREIREEALREIRKRGSFRATPEGIYDLRHSRAEHWVKLAPGFFMRERLVHE